ncbi:BYS1domainprotein,putative [Macrophomina phaseolina MS6]|uniref:BYS1domainprotein,putative n=1 Tax=Macrophomina phaseolina (strain MS6) TaxID=1126212 RepID=K2QYT6_MACPH|nr:BYS1domainprotein,putative [Macrophomina phaseolina MS6]
MKLIAPLAALAFVSTASAALQGKMINNCKIPVYAKTTRGGSAASAYDSREMVKVPPGGVYYAKVKTVNNAPGVCLNVQPTPDPAWKNVYQVEFAQSDTPGTSDGTASWAWYDLSTVDASPFKNRWRRLEVAGMSKACRVLECAPGRTDCEWPVPEKGEMGDCKSGKDAEIVFTLCRK